MVFGDVPISYALDRRHQGKVTFGIRRSVHSRRISLLFALGLWSYTAVFVILLINFQADFWLVSAIWVMGSYLPLVAFNLRRRRNYIRSK